MSNLPKDRPDDAADRAPILEEGDDQAFPALPIEVIFSNGFAVAFWLAATALVPPLAWQVRSPMAGVAGGALGGLFALLAAAAYLSLTRRESKYAAWAASTWLIPRGACGFGLFLCSWLVLLTGISPSALAAGSVLLMLFLVCHLARLANLSWLQALRDRETLHWDEPPPRGVRVSLRELLGLLAVAAPVFAAWKALAP